MENKEVQNHGLIIPPILNREQGVEHLLGGANDFGLVINPSGDWFPFLAEKEYQKIGSVETMNCSGYGTLNCVETLLKSKGVLANYSDRYLGILAGTNPNFGNDPHVVAETLRNVSGCLDEQLLPFVDIQTAIDYYKPKPMTPDLLKKGQEWYNTYDFAHKWVFSGGTPAYKKEKLKEALTKGTIGVSVFAWVFDDSKQFYTKPEGAKDNHWVQLVRINETGEFIVFDSYDGFVKRLDPDYNFEMAKIYYLTPAGPKISILAKILDLIGRILNLEALLIKIQVTPPKVPTSTIPVAPTNPYWVANPSKVYGLYPNVYPENLQQKLIDRTKEICKEEGLTDQLAEEVRCTISGESGWNPFAENSNKDTNGKVLSTDFGIVQINDYYHIGAGKSFPSSEYVLNNPEKCIEWMAKMFKAGKANLWMAHANWKKFEGVDLKTMKSWYK